MNRILPSARYLAILGLATLISFVVGCTLNVNNPNQPPTAQMLPVPTANSVSPVANNFQPYATDVSCNVLERTQTSHSLIKNYPKQRQAFAPNDCAQTCWQLFSRHLAKRMRLGFKAVENFTVTECGSSVDPRYGVNLACKARFTLLQQEEWLAKTCAARS